jgi:photosystem II stability/assembly factor-like uncharacterized protein
MTAGMRALLHDAAESVVASPDLAERAERAYRRRIGRQRVIAGVLALWAFGVVATVVSIERSPGTAITAGTPEVGPPVAIDRLADVYYLTASHAYAVTGDAPADIAVSVDAGRHWNRVGALRDAEPAATGREIVFINDADGFVRGGGVLHLTHDGGRTWDTVDRSFVSIGPARVDETVWALAGCESVAGCVPRVDVSHDRGSTWSTARTQPERVSDNLGDIVGISAAVAYVTSPSARTLWRTDDGGTTWAPASLPCSTGAAQLSGPIQGALWVLCPGSPGQAPAAYRSLDGGKSWIPAGGPPAPTAVHDFGALSEKTAVVTATGGAVYATADAGATWRRTLTLPAGSTGVIGVRSGMKMWLLTSAESAERGLWTSADGSRWTRLDAASA